MLEKIRINRLTDFGRSILDQVKGGFGIGFRNQTTGLMSDEELYEKYKNNKIQLALINAYREENKIPPLGLNKCCDTCVTQGMIK